jgi:hypothetical protein
MSKTLQTLLKIAQKKLDDQTQVLAKLNGQKQDFITEKARLLANITTQIDSVKDDLLAFQMAQNYAIKAKAGILYLDDQIIKINELIAVENKILQNLFLEKKRAEIMLENFNKKRKAELAKKEQSQLDDFSSIAYTNKHR